MEEEDPPAPTIQTVLEVPEEEEEEEVATVVEEEDEVASCLRRLLGTRRLRRDRLEEAGPRTNISRLGR